MPSFKDMAAEIGMSMVENTLKMYVSELLASIKEHNDAEPKLYIDIVQDGHAWLTRLQKLALKTKTKLDDRGVRVFLDPVQQAAAMDDIPL
jgi:hypothetical protein